MGTKILFLVNRSPFDILCAGKNLSGRSLFRQEASGNQPIQVISTMAAKESNWCENPTLIRVGLEVQQECPK